MNKTLIALLAAVSVFASGSVLAADAAMDKPAAEAKKDEAKPAKKMKKHHVKKAKAEKKADEKPAEAPAK